MRRTAPATAIASKRNAGTCSDGPSIWRPVPAGARCSSCNASRRKSATATADIPWGNSSWDMHGGHMGMGNAFSNGTYGMGWCLPVLDEALSALITDLQERGLLGRTL